MTTTDRYGEENRARDGQFLLELAEAAGARPRPAVNGRSTGFCPFHGDPARAISRDLSLDTKLGRFKCAGCRISDYTSGFAARIWRMSRRDAQELITAGVSPTTQRPPFQRDNPYWQNTALLTRAMTHYRDNLHYSPEAIWYLATLGITINEAAQIGLGWCQHDHITATIASLKRDGITESEIDQSPLFHQQNRENLAGCIVMPDLDTCGGVTWMVGIRPQGPDTGQPWPNRPPPANLLRGSRPYLLGLRAAETRGQRLYVTDDYRLAIRLRAQNRAAACAIGRHEPATAARHAAAARPREIAVVYSNANNGRALANALVDDHGLNRSNVLLGTPAITSSVINDRTVNLAEILQEGQPRQAEEHATTDKDKQNAPSPA